MDRGNNKIFNDLIEIKLEKHRKGRSINFAALRNTCLIDRYLFFVLLSDKRYDIIISTLSKEFFLSPITITNVLQSNYEELIALKKKYQELKEKNKHNQVKGELAKKWQHLVWVLN